MFPTKEQAIVIDAIENVPIDEYARAIGNKVGATEVHFISRISRDRLCIYVSSKELADKLIEKHEHVIIAGSLTISPMLTQNKRIIISNVQPFIPHHELERIL